MSKVTDVALINANEKALAAAGLFRDVNFNELNGIINALGEKSAELTPEEKTSAINIVSEWENNIIERMNNYNGKMGSLINMFRPGSDYSYWTGKNQYVTPLTYEQIMQLVTTTETDSLWSAFMGAYEAWQLYGENCPTRPYTDSNMSRNEIKRLELKYDLDYAKYSQERTRLQRKVVAAHSAFLKVVNQHDYVKAMIAKAKDYQAGLKTSLAECHSKTTMAKLNIQISSKDIRNAIHDLLNFAQTV